MVTERRAPKAASQAVGGVLKLFARAARARQIYNENNAVLVRMRKDLVSAFDGLLRAIPDVSLKVRSDSFLFEDEPVFEEPNPDESIPFAFYRDGVRRIDFSRGLGSHEIDVLVAATAQGFSFSGLGDDIVAYLWRHDLEHVRYVVVDTTIVDAAQAAGVSASGVELGPVNDVDAQIEGLLRAIYGNSSEDVGPRTVHVDATDLPAKQIAERLDAVDEMAPGFHPPRGFLHAPGYQDALIAEIGSFTDRDVTLRAMYCGFWALQELKGGSNAEAICEAMLRAYDTALVEEDLAVATYIVRGMQQSSQESGRAREWLDQAIDDARLRQVTSIISKSIESQASSDGFAFFRACGKRALDSLLSQIPGISEPNLRRSYADLALELGIEDVDLIRPLITNEQAFVAQEGVYLLSKIPGDAALRLLDHASDHPHPVVRLAFIEHLHRLPEERRYATAVRLLEDRDDRIKIAAARSLAASKNKDAGLVMKELIRKLEFVDAPYDVKEAFLRTYAIHNQVWSLRFLTKFVKKGTAMLAKPKEEELAVAAAKALAEVPTQRTIDCLEEAAKSRKKRLRDASREVLDKMKGKQA
jgi:HEAT repeat protein